MESVFLHTEFGEELKGITASVVQRIRENVGAKVNVKVEIFPSSITEGFIKRAVLTASMLDWKDLAKRSRRWDVVRARYLCCYFLHTTLNLGPVAIARRLNCGYDHSDVIRGIKAVRNMLQTGYEPYVILHDAIKQILLDEIKA